jgi:hypothetical protein
MSILQGFGVALPLVVLCLGGQQTVARTLRRTLCQRRDSRATANASGAWRAATTIKVSGPVSAHT